MEIARLKPFPFEGESLHQSVEVTLPHLRIEMWGTPILAPVKIQTVARWGVGWFIFRR
jgi:hypothetical protein